MFGSISRALDPNRKITQYVLNNWQTEQGLPQNSIIEIYQTQDGYLWLGTEEGLIRFNGSQFESFNSSKIGFEYSNYISCMYQDRVGNFWIGTYGDGLICYKENQFKLLTSQDGLVSNYISRIHEDSNGVLWIGTEFGLCAYKEGKFRSITMNSKAFVELVGSFYETSDDSLLITTNKGVYLMHGDSLRPFWSEIADYTQDIRDIIKDSIGNYWMGVHGLGLVRYDGSRASVIVDSAKGLLSNDIMNLYKSSNGMVWIATRKGLNRYYRGEIDSLTEFDGLSLNDIRSIYEDREGNLWIGTYGGGLNRLKDGKFTSFTTREGLSAKFIWSLYQDFDSSIWIATHGGGLNHLQHGKVTIYTTQEGLCNNFISSIARDPLGNLLVGTHYGGLNVILPNKMRHITTKNGLPANSIRALFKDSENTIWIGTGGGGLCRWKTDSNSFQTISVNDGLCDNYVQQICEDTSQNLWIATKGGLNRIDLKTRSVKSYTTQSGLPYNNLRCLFVDDENNLWIGTKGGGLILLSGDKFSLFTTEHGLYDNTIFGILNDNENYMWFSCNRGLFKIRRTELLAISKSELNSAFCISYGQGSGMKNQECNGGVQPSCLKSYTGSLWFPTVDGVVNFNPEKMPYNKEIPPVFIEAIIIDRDTIYGNSPVIFNPGTERFEIHYAGLSYMESKKNQYKYKLEGFDTDWVNAGNRNIAFYTNIRPGVYLFRVIACNNDGLWNEEGAVISIRIQYFFYQTRWFYLLMALFVFVLGMALNSLRIRHKKSKELESLNNQLLNANEELVKANQVKDELLHIAAHEMKNPLQIISGFAQLIGKVSEKSSIQEKAQKIFESSHRMKTIIERLLESAAIESGTVQPKLTRFNIREVIEKVVKNNSEHAQQKRQCFKFEINQDVEVLTDRELLVEAVDNLISNALKFSPFDTVITTKIECFVNEIRIRVSDQGPGITNEDREKIFGKFTKLSARPTGNEVSTGLGLSIVKQIMELLGGRVECDSLHKGGASFILILTRTNEN